MRINFNNGAEKVIVRFAAIHNITNEQALLKMVNLMGLFNGNAMKGYKLGLVHNETGAFASFDVITGTIEQR
jgi:hypothetical protein